MNRVVFCCLFVLSVVAYVKCQAQCGFSTCKPDEYCKGTGYQYCSPYQKEGQRCNMNFEDLRCAPGLVCTADTQYVFFGVNYKCVNPNATTQQPAETTSSPGVAGTTVRPTTKKPKKE